MLQQIQTNGIAHGVGAKQSSTVESVGKRKHLVLPSGIFTKT